jgi:hypothetical protein
MLPLQQTFLLLLRLRGVVARRTLMRGGAARPVGLALALFLLVPASGAAGAEVTRALARERTDAGAVILLALVLCAIQGVWIAARLAPDGMLTLGRGLPVGTLRPYPVRSLYVALTEAAGSLIDLPLFVALPVLAAVARFVGSGAVSLLVAVAALALLLAQTAALAQVLEHAAALALRRRVRTLLIPVAGALLALSLVYAYARPAEAATNTTTPRLWHPRNSLSASKTVPARTAATDTRRWALWSPAGLAARSLGEARKNHLGAALLPLAGLAGVTVLTFGAAGGLLGASIGRVGEGGGGTRYPRRLLPSRAYRDDTAEDRLPSALVQTATVAALEWRSLVRAPQSHLPLRGPAALLFTLVFGWMAPDLGGDSLVNLRDALGMGSILYALLWQIQLLCGRFGTEAGTAALIFGLPVNRRHLIIGKNVALLGLLLVADGAAVALLCGVARAPHLLLPMLLWLPAVLLTATALGNPLSVLLPFPIPRRGETFRAEPGRGVAFLYIGAGFAVWGLLWPVQAGLGFARGVGPTATVAVLCGAALWVSALYAGSVVLTERLLRKREQRLVGVLDGEEAGA